MRKDDKIAVLRGLLAKVRANAGDRLARGPASAASAPAPPQVTPASVHDPLPLQPFDSWSTAEAPLSRVGATFARTLPPPPFSIDIPPPSATPRFDEAPEDAGLEGEEAAAAASASEDGTRRDDGAMPSISPEELDLFDAAALPIASTRGLLDELEDNGGSALARALELATREPRVDPAAHGAIFTSAQHTLQKRRSTAPPGAPEEDVHRPREAERAATRSPLRSRPPSAPPLVNASAAPASVAPPSTLARRPRRRSFRGARPTRARGRGAVVAVAVASLAVVAAAVAVGLSLRRPPAPIASAASTEIAAMAVLQPTSTPAGATQGAAPTPLAAASASAAPTAARFDPGHDATSPREAPAPRPPVPDGSRLAADKGYLFVDAPPGRQVYANGVLVGDGAAWLVVPCGFRYLRLAERMPAAARSFPAWSGEGVSVVIPCRGATSATP